MDTKFTKHIKIAKSGCHEWQSALTKAGYGQICRMINGKAKTMRCHRYIWEQTFGPIDSGLFVLHKCDNKKCCNIEHLFLGSALANAQDRDSKGRFVQSMAKLTEAQILEIRQKYDNITTAKMIAKQYNVALCTVHRIGKRKSWVNL